MAASEETQVDIIYSNLSQTFPKDLRDIGESRSHQTKDLAILPVEIQGAWRNVKLYWKFLGFTNKSDAKGVFFSSQRALLFERFLVAAISNFKVSEQSQQGVLYFNQMLRGVLEGDRLSEIQLAKFCHFRTQVRTTLRRAKGLLRKLISLIKPLVSEAAKDPRADQVESAQRALLAGTPTFEDYSILNWFYGLDGEITSDEEAVEFLEFYMSHVGFLPNLRTIAQAHPAGMGLSSSQNPYKRVFSNYEDYVAIFGDADVNLAQFGGVKDNVTNMHRFNHLQRLFEYSRDDIFDYILQKSGLSLKKFREIIQSQSPSRLLEPTTDFSAFADAFQRKWPRGEWASLLMGMLEPKDDTTVSTIKTAPPVYEIILGGDLATLKRILAAHSGPFDQEILSGLVSDAKALRYDDMSTLLATYT